MTPKDGAPPDATEKKSVNLADATPGELFLNRELSLLEFNRRVLAQSLDPSIPLLERLKFLCISSSNLDEFFEIRVAGLQQMADAGSKTTGADGLTPSELLTAIGGRAHALVEEQYRVFNEVLIPELEKEKIRFLRRGEWSKDQDDWLKDYFDTELLPVLSPIGLDPAHPFPRILNKSLNFIASLSGKDAFGRNTAFAIVQAPRALPRLIQIPKEVKGSGPHDFVFLSSVIHAYIDDLFPGMEASGCYQFRVTRNSDLLVDEEESEDLLEALEGQLEMGRKFGDTVRLEVAHNCPETMWRYLMDVTQLTADDVYQCNGPVNLNRLLAIPDLVDRPDLKYAPFTPRQPKALSGDIFAAIRERDILLHHPFDSFTPVVDFLRQAAKDPKVLAIKQTLYRTGDKSPVVGALIEAARSGKEVTVVVELRARFDEENNIDLAEKLQEAGAHVTYGVVGHKTHAKMCLIVRREQAATGGSDKLRHYVHLGTGNYHPRTARQYTDYGLFTADPAVCKDAHAVFLQLTSLSKTLRLKHLLQSPFTLSKEMHKKIDREIELAAKGEARIVAKMNSLVEPEIIKSLYRASAAGVQIDLVVRGMCSLRPGVPGLSENIRVRSVVGRFLEHHRVFYFHNGGEPEVYLSSADWMERNLFRRVEIAFPLLDKKLRERVIEQLLAYLDDSPQTWWLQADGTYRQSGKTTGKNIQQKLMEEAATS